MSDEAGFVSFTDLAIRDDRQQTKRKAALKSIKVGANEGANEGALKLLAVGGGTDASADIYSDGGQPLPYLADEPIEGAPPRREGYLTKEGHSAGGRLAGGLLGASDWRRRWFVLSNGFLEYFELPPHSPLPWGTHLTRDDLLHAPNCKGHVCLFRAHQAEPKNARVDGKGDKRAAWRLDCDASAAAVYNESYGGRALLCPAAMQQSADALACGPAACASGKSDTPQLHRATSSFSPVGGGSRPASATARRLAGLLAPFRAGAGSGGARSGRTRVPSTPGMHVKYVLAADTEQASAEWRKAIEAHVRFASSAQGMKAYHHVLQARELVRKARAEALTLPQRQLLLPPSSAPAAAVRRRCETLHGGVGYPATLCQDCAGDKRVGFGSCAVCGNHAEAGRGSSKLVIRSAALCNSCSDRAAGRCCRCDAELRGPHVSPTLCAACGAGEGAARCCKMVSEDRTPPQLECEVVLAD